MEKLKILDHIRDLYNSGENIISYLNGLDKKKENSVEDIMISYDFQAGSYIKALQQNFEYSNNYTTSIAKVINNLGGCDSILEVGVGEATTITTLLPKLNKVPSSVFGFDISFSRICYGMDFSKKKNIPINLFVGDLFNIPILDNSVDIVYSSHSLEPNGGKEEEILKELSRIAKKYIVLLEPSFEFADKEGRERMKRNGYVIDLHKSIKKSGMDILEYRKFDYCINPLNPTGLTIIKQPETEDKYSASDFFACPINKTPLIKVKNHLFSPESLLLYPVINEIPCLLESNAIVASKWQEV